MASRDPGDRPYAPSSETMLEQLFGSKTRVRLLRLFLTQQEEAFFVRELTRKVGAQINAIRNELENLVAMDLIEIDEAFINPQEDAVAPATRAKERKNKDAARATSQRKYYRLNKASVLYPELRALFLKSRILLEKDLIRRITKAGPVSYLALLGYFVGDEEAPTDAIVVGKINKEKLATIMRSFEREVGHEINYTVMTPHEFRYRMDLTDRFLYAILESRKVVVSDTITQRDVAPIV
jgi:hypothetical protein